MEFFIDMVVEIRIILLAVVVCHTSHIFSDLRAYELPSGPFLFFIEMTSKLLFE